MLLTIGGLFITQVYWFKKSFTLEERQFDEKLNIALRNIAHQLLVLDNDTSSRIPPISKLASNEFYVKTNCHYNLSVLDSCIKSEFNSRKIAIDFDYLIIKAESDEVLLGNSVWNVYEPAEIACKGRLDNKDLLDFKIRINNKTTYLINSMGIWMYSSTSLLVLLAVFTFIIVSIVKGKRLSDLKKDFVNNMTHELKTPIANISVASEAIRNRNVQMDEDKLKKYADIIYNENVRLHNLVDRVLQISAIEKQDESLSFEEVDIHKTITKVLVSFGPLLQKRNGTINSNLNADKFTIQADKTHLSNVIYNLIENAIKYSNNSPELTISTSNNKNGINIEVRDKGIGIAKANQQRIFEQFFRVETGDVHNTKGHGIGLSYVKLIVEKHNGLLTFRSKENKGTTFNIFLPI